MSAPPPAASAIADVKREYSGQAWNELLDSVPLSKQGVDALILDFLVKRGYKNAANAFVKETSIEVPGSESCWPWFVFCRRTGEGILRPRLPQHIFPLVERSK